MRIESAEIATMETRQRAALINSLSGFKSANLVGTVDSDGHTNLAIMSSVVHLGSNPPLLALVIRPGGAERHTLANILATGSYSLNHVNAAMIEAAHQTAARYAHRVSEFDATGLTPLWLDGFGAPLVNEANIRLGLELREHQRLDINDTHLVIGEVVIAELPDGSLRGDGSIDLGVADTIALSGLDSYHTAVQLRRMAYAKPDQPPRSIDFDSARATPMPTTGETP